MADFIASPERLAALLEGLARFSAPGPGVTRLVYGREWRDAAQWLAAEARTRGLACTHDAAGNLWFHPAAVRPGDPSRPVVIAGSHLDSVVHGGPLDGALGAVAGLMLAAEARGWSGAPVVGLVTCEEEESRFEAGFMGARAALGRVERAELAAVRDRDGISWEQALEPVRNAGCAAPLPAKGEPFVPPFRGLAFLELHIEQGPVLEAEGLALGLVEHVAGFRRLRGIVRGEARHSGTTPMERRRDALAAAATMILEVESLGLRSGEAARATAGFARALPGLVNVIPGEVELGLEVRHVDPGSLAALAAGLAERCGALAAARGVTLAIEEVSRQEPTPMAPALVDHAERAAQGLGLAARRMASGAAHDAMIFARAGVPSTMLFVPSRGGISHSPDEHTDTDALFDGYRALRELARGVAARGRV